MEIKIGGRIDYMGLSYRADRISMHSEFGLKVEATPHVFIDGSVAMDGKLAPKRKPFDLEAAKAGAKLVTRDGRLARFLAHVPEAGEAHRVIAYIDGDDESLQFCENGYFRIGGAETTLDLFLAAETKTIYVNLYKNGRTGYGLACYWDAADEARDKADEDAIAVAVPVEIDA